jgi:hypothetical protein
MGWGVYCRGGICYLRTVVGDGFGNLSHGFSTQIFMPVTDSSAKLYE